MFGQGAPINTLFPQYSIAAPSGSCHVLAAVPTSSILPRIRQLVPKPMNCNTQRRYDINARNRATQENSRALASQRRTYLAP